MRAIVAAVIAVSVLYLLDQQVTNGRYTDAAEQMVGQIRQSLGM